MQATQTEHALIIRETPGCLWIFGLFFAVIGGAFVYGALGGFADYALHGPWTLAAAFLMGACGVAAGVWIVSRAPITRIEIDRLDEKLYLTRYALSGRTFATYHFDEIERFYLIEETDDEGAPVWSLGLAFADGETLKISAMASHDERFKREFVFQANEFLGVEMLAAPYAAELADETDGEMS